MKIDKELFEIAKNVLKNDYKSNKKIVLAILTIANYLGFDYLTTKEIAKLASMITGKNEKLIRKQLHDIAKDCSLIEKNPGGKFGKFSKLSLKINDEVEKEILKTELLR
ncbi:MAG: hypothetical protein GXO43_04930 [Crenarchaeota archaeon]|nr:hypothetical protein [Thermoproteota archaeon]